MKNHYPEHYSMNLERAGFHYGAFGYAITDVAAKKIIKENTPVIHEPDIIIPLMIVDNKLEAYRLKHEIVEHAYKLNQQFERVKWEEKNI